MLLDVVAPTTHAVSAQHDAWSKFGVHASILQAIYRVSYQDTNFSPEGRLWEIICGDEIDRARIILRDLIRLDRLPWSVPERACGGIHVVVHFWSSENTETQKRVSQLLSEVLLEAARPWLQGGDVVLRDLPLLDNAIRLSYFIKAKPCLDTLHALRQISDFREIITSGHTLQETIADAISQIG